MPMCHFAQRHPRAGLAVRRRTKERLIPASSALIAVRLVGGRA